MRADGGRLGWREMPAASAGLGGLWPGWLGLGRALLLVVVLATSLRAVAAGPRWVSGPPYFSQSGVPIAWYTASPLYYTDPADLSATVNHAAADALVANAAAVWNVPTASLTLGQGGTLAEHVTGASITVSGGGAPVMPADVQSANWQNIPIAIFYDTDGSVIDALLGTGGSDPSGCLQNGVVESVDLFGTASTIEHAILILNGRCTGSDSRQQMQMEYQLVRAFGRILGVGWSQTNDNVFTGSPAATNQQAQYWPVMHPIDVICGPYTYLCLPNPFKLRPDDLSALAQLYFVSQGQGGSLPGKQDSLANGSELEGQMLFPDGEGMEGVNVTARRHPIATTSYEPFQVVSGVSGYSFRRQNGTPVAGQDGSPMSSIGTYDGSREGYFQMKRIPLLDGLTSQAILMTTEAVNPLYTGPYALTTAAASSTTIAPSGSAVQQDSGIWTPYADFYYALTASDAVASCGAASDGTESTPVAMPASGWWTGSLCGYGHSAWTSLNLKLNHSFSVEVTALNEAGVGSAVKAMPMIGLWQTSDATGQSPTAGQTTQAFNSGVTGMSTVRLSSAPASELRMVFTDQRGAGRNDFAYQARVLYADAVTPANVGAYGGTVVISGSGFRPGVQVAVNGYSAVVMAVTPTSVTVRAPSLQAIGSSQALLAPVSVIDPTTGGTTTIPEALGYGSPQERLQLVSAPTGTVTQGRPAATPFAVRVLATDGVTPVVGETVTLAFTAGSGAFGICGGATCTAQTDANGVVSTVVTATSLGGVALRASTPLLTVRASFTTIAAPDMVTLVSAPASVATVGVASATAFSVRVMAGDGVTPRVGQTVTLAAEGGAAQMTACGAASCSVRTDANGMASSVVMPLVVGTIALDGNAAAGTVHASFTAAAERIALVSAPSGLVTVGRPVATPFAVKLVGGDGVTPLAGAPVVLNAAGGAVEFTACGGSSCTVMTDANGTASSGLVATVAGAVTLTATAGGVMAGGGTVTAAFTVGSETMQLVSAPTGVVTVGTTATPVFAVRVMGADGVTPIAGEAVSFAGPSGSVVLGACGGAVCRVLTDASGLAATSVTLEVVSAITVTASSPGGVRSTSLMGHALPDVIEVVSVPTATAYTGTLLSPGLVMRLLLADGVTPVVGQAMTFTVTGGAASFGACGGASCTVLTDANGTATTTVTPALAGALTVVVNVPSALEAAAQTVSLAVAALRRTIVAVTPVQYVAEGVSASWTEQVAVSDNAGGTVGVPVAWAGDGALQLGAAAGTGGVVSAGGLASEVVGVAGLGAGVESRGEACAWSVVCAEFAVRGVSATAWQIQVVAGAGQQASADGGLSPVMLRVSDASGHPVLGATVTVHQQVTAWQQACPTQGRCPGATVLSSGVSTVVSDADGLLVVIPLEVAGTAEATEVTASAGTGGIWTVLLEKHP